ncbi:L,D-transpeptidase family protein [Granulicella paludicola]|uniref:L,D-transpeptidase family protein n=1 Tax=Granulicella paludicola TaxID=474951 RepID=UPI0021DFCA16|nr:L,D-transpeptidase family protein [Granulicella paludicola]
MNTQHTTATRLTFALSLALLSLSGCKHHAKGGITAAFSGTDYPGQIQAITTTSQLADLRWPNYSEYQQKVQDLYNGRDSGTAWIDGDKASEIAPTSAATQMIQIFTDAAQKGLDPEDYDASRWPARLQRIADIRKKSDTSSDAQRDVAQFDVALTVCAIRYLSDLHLGRINPQTLNFDIDVPGKRAAFDVVKLLNDQVLSSSDVANVVASIEPQNPLYKNTEAALPHYLELAKQQDANPTDPLPGLNGAKPIEAGGHYAATDALLTRLQLEGDSDASETSASPANDANAAAKPASTAYTKALADGVKKFQGRHGLTVDGKLGQGTIDAMNVPLHDRVKSIDDALERWRWLPDNYQQPRVFVNLPEFMLRAYGTDHSLAFKMLVIDGEAKGFHDTPMFVRLMRYVVFRPYWNLPPSIIKKEIVPHVQKSGIGYLTSHDYEMTDHSGKVVTSASVSDIEHLRYAVRQKPGPKNSLGLVKFLFPNEYDVYMHSTPELFLFNLTRRDRSHGCVRLQHADQMALWVLGGDQKDPENQTRWDADSIHDAMNAEDENNKTYGLKTPLPVVLTYMTAMADEDGTMHFFNDIYGYDKDLNTALAKGRPYAQGPAKINPTLVAGETE